MNTKTVLCLLPILGAIAGLSLRDVIFPAKQEPGAEAQPQPQAQGTPGSGVIRFNSQTAAAQAWTSGHPRTAPPAVNLGGALPTSAPDTMIGAPPGAPAPSLTMPAPLPAPSQPQSQSERGNTMTDVLEAMVNAKPLPNPGAPID